MTEAEQAVYAYLHSHDIPYESAAHERVHAISECVIAEELLGARMPRNLFLTPRNQSAFYLLIAHPDSAFKTSSVSKQAGASRLSFADDEALMRILHTHPGAVSPMGLIFESAKDVRFLVDRRLLNEDALLFHPLENTSSLKLTKEAFFEKFLVSLGRSYLPVDMDEKRSDAE